MEVARSAQQWSFDSDPPEFLCTQIVFKDGGDYFLCQSKERQPKLDIESINSLSPQKILREHIWPLLEGGLTVCDDPTNPDIYIKKPRLTTYDSTPALAHLVLQEARVCEILMRNPHPNVARYLGCYVQEGRIAGLCFQRYAETAEERKTRGLSINKALVVDQINAAIAHLHCFKLAHNDVKASNVMFPTKRSENAILVDFDSCAMISGPPPAKRGFMDSSGIEELAKFLS
jgi:serine/threonine protein kinase